jgi:UrcA family protein
LFNAHPFWEENMTNKLRGALIAAGAVLAATAATAQDYGYQNGADENVIVVAPDYYYHAPYPSNQMGRPPEATTLSQAVSFNDLDLTTRDGAHELRARVRDAAQGICGELAARYPVRMAVSEPCYKKAVESGMNRADAAIREARSDDYSGDYEY